MRKRIEKKSLAAVLTLCLLLLIPVSAKAESLNFQKTGALTVTMRDNETKKPVAGGSVTVYQAAGVRKEDGNLSYEFTEDFRDCGQKLENPQDYELAETLKTYAEKKKLSGETKRIGRDGRAVYAGLPAGLYLVVQTEAAEGYYKISPFLVGVPQKNGEAWEYEVDAEPKMELNKPKQPKPTPEEPKQPKPPAGPTPKTGDQALPFAALMISGGMLTAAHLLRRKKGAE